MQIDMHLAKRSLRSNFGSRKWICDSMAAIFKNHYEVT